MSPRRLAYALGFVVLVTSGAYVFIYLYRWEWNRALFAGFLFIATEVALATAAVLERLHRVGNQLEDVRRRPAPDPEVLGRIREAAPSPRAHFAWLSRRGNELGIFVPVLMGAGVVMSGVAWLVERVARTSALPVLERRLAAQLAPLRFPSRGLLPPPGPGLGPRL